MFETVGPITPAQSRALLLNLDAHATPGTADPGVPWAAAVLRSDGSFVLAASTMVTAGVFWSLDQVGDEEYLIADTDLGSVVGARRTPAYLDESWVAKYAVAAEEPTCTPYTGVWRLPPGCAFVTTANGRPRLIEWARDSWTADELDLHAALASYREVFSDVMRRLTVDMTAIPVAMSGGLDSTYVAAVAASARSAHQPVHAFVSSPVPGLVDNPSVHAVTDDLPAAGLMADRYPGRLRLEVVRNDERVAPLDAAAVASAESWWPVPAPENWIWMSQIARGAIALGSQRLLVGTHGNWAFSGYWPATQPQRTSIMRRMRHVARATRVRLAGSPDCSETGVRGSATNAVVFTDGWAPPGYDPRPFHERFRDGLSMRNQTSAAMANTGLFDGCIMWVDPFTAPDLLALAARISPDAWGCEPSPRGFARRVSAGLVPDEIRLRRARGAQAPDSWLWINNLRGQYLARVDALTDTPVLRDMIEIERMRMRIAQWPWGEPAGPPKPELNRVHRILALADFVHMTRQRLGHLPRSGSSM